VASSSAVASQMQSVLSLLGLSRSTLRQLWLPFWCFQSPTPGMPSGDPASEPSVCQHEHCRTDRLACGWGRFLFCMHYMRKGFVFIPTEETVFT